MEGGTEGSPLGSGSSVSLKGTSGTAGRGGGAAKGVEAISSSSSTGMGWPSESGSGVVGVGLTSSSSNSSKGSGTGVWCHRTSDARKVKARALPWRAIKVIMHGFIIGLDVLDLSFVRLLEVDETSDASRLELHH